MKRVAAALVLSLMVGIASSETITYEIFKLGPNNAQTQLASGAKNYTVADIQITESWGLGPKFWDKGLYLAQDFWVGANVHREQSLSGFGLWIRRQPKWYEIWSDGGFSWEWFNHEKGNIYRKLQGPGRLRVETFTGNGYVELTAVEFLDDVTLRLNDAPWFLFSNGKTHHVVIRKGSVLRVAP